MTNTVVIGCADQALAYELRSQLDELGDLEIGYIAETTSEFSSAVIRLEPDVVILHDATGPQTAIDVVRELSLRRPTMSTIVVCSDPSPESLMPLVEAGARGILTYPLAFEEVEARVRAATEWSRAMSDVVATPHDPVGGVGARVICFTGSKGGVGTSTVATHIALDVAREVPNFRVALLDLDLEKGDVSSLIDVRYRSSIADVARVSNDLNVRTIADAVVPHDSGLHLLLTPHQVQDVEFITPQSVRIIIATLRQAYDLVIIDGGSHVTPTQVAAVELADEVVIVTTPDVLSLRGVRRNLDSWDGLGVRKAETTRVLVNNSSKHNAIQADLVHRLAQAPVISVALPSLHKQLEAAVNSRDPLTLRESSWWKALRAIGKEIELVPVRPRTDVAAEAIKAEISTRRSERRRGRGKRRQRGGKVAGSESGQISIETVGLLPAILLICVFLWQIGLVGMSSIYASHAADAAARQASLGKAPGPSAYEKVPSYFRHGMSVDPSSTAPGDGVVTVHVKVPLFVPGVFSGPWSIDATRKVVQEP
ncbi:AAA family ATPase [Flexivirga alba]|uniref:CpaE family protein n=1 Tax=Flexivirga alba TaxID=702742 RepID=A0ABW2AN99_9MICO